LSDGYSDVEKQIAATDPRKLMGLTAKAAEKRHACAAAARGSAVFMGVLRVLLILARPLAASLPHGATVADLVGVGLDIVERET